jgi:hypothetical protein
MLYQESYEELLPPFSERVMLSRQFLEDNLVICGVICLVVAILIIIKSRIWVKDKYETTEDTDRPRHSAKNRNRVGLAEKLLYDSLLFPLAAGFFPIILLSGFINNILLTTEAEPYF